MITAGIDAGIENIKAVVLKDGEVLARGTAPSGGTGRAKAVEQLYQEVLAQAGVKTSEVNKVVATGMGKWDVPFAEARVVEPVADARAAAFLAPEAGALIDIGADQWRAVTYDSTGKIKKYSLNHKCAAGVGLYLESMAMALGLSLEEMSWIKDGARNVIVNDQCAVLGELDVVTLIHDNAETAGIVQAINAAAATKLAAMVNEMTGGIGTEAVLMGGVAANAGLVKAFEQHLGVNFIIPEQPQYGGALGAALMAAS